MKLSRIQGLLNCAAFFNAVVHRCEVKTFFPIVFLFKTNILRNFYEIKKFDLVLYGKYFGIQYAHTCKTNLK